MRTCPKGGKRCYSSPSAARRANKKVGNRFRVYPCRACRSYHITAEPKR